MRILDTYPREVEDANRDSYAVGRGGVRYATSPTPLLSSQGAVGAELESTTNGRRIGHYLGTPDYQSLGMLEVTYLLC